MRLFVLLCTLTSICTAQRSDVDQNPEVHQYKTGLGHVRVSRQAPAQQPNYRPYSQAPSQIKQLLQFQQAREPIVNLPAQPPPQLTPGQGHQGGPQIQTQSQVSSYRPNIQFGAAPQQNIQPRPQQPQQGAYRPAPQQPSYRPQQPAYAPQQPAYNPQYRPQGPPQQQQQPHYSKNIPPAIQQLIQAQQNQQG